ncbi:MAG: hypothetical protein AB7O28_18215 [Vicinamibacterales bacterium]
MSALVGAFYAGGLVHATSAGDQSQAVQALAAQDTALPPADGLSVECEPGQRAVVRTSATGTPAGVACLTDAPAIATARANATPMAAPRALPVADSMPAPRARPAVMTEPMEVYRPRSVPVSSPTRDEVARPSRTWERSAVIIGSSAVVGATLGGLTKGKKGAVVGGIVGGGAATVWDQVTRRRNDAERR